MATIKSHTDLSQSKTLSKILPLESADMYYNPRPSNEIPYVGNANTALLQVPCWSLAALLGVLPKIHELKPILDLEENSIQYSGVDLYIMADNPVDACYEMILKLNELKRL